MASAPTKRAQGSSAKGTAAIAKEQAVAAGAETSESVSKGTTKETEDKENEGPASAGLLEALPAPVASSTAKGKSGPTRAKKTELVEMEKPVTRRTLRSRA
ncbi:hypothetical protein BT69DRAFT_193946 [Atractiella rhizophila]|nr:hypothetical protein BT69DRAFT_193946 [Atractiella rhizophila]